METTETIVGRTWTGEYFFYRKNGMKDVFPTLEKMRYELSQYLGSLQAAENAIKKAGL